MSYEYLMLNVLIHCPYIYVVDMTIIMFYFACCIYCEYQFHVYAQFGIYMFYRIVCSTLFLATPKVDSLRPTGC